MRHAMTEHLPSIVNCPLRFNVKLKVQLAVRNNHAVSNEALYCQLRLEANPIPPPSLSVKHSNLGLKMFRAGCLALGFPIYRAPCFEILQGNFPRKCRSTEAVATSLSPPEKLYLV